MCPLEEDSLQGNASTFAQPEPNQQQLFFHRKQRGLPEGKFSHTARDDLKSILLYSTYINIHKYI